MTVKDPTLEQRAALRNVRIHVNRVMRSSMRHDLREAVLVEQMKAASEAGWSVRDMAKACGVSTNWVWRRMKGREPRAEG